MTLSHKIQIGLFLLALVLFALSWWSGHNVESEGYDQKMGDELGQGLFAVLAVLVVAVDALWVVIQAIVRTL